MFIETNSLFHFFSLRRSESLYYPRFMSFLRKFDIGFEEKYVFKFIEENPAPPGGKYL